MQQENESVEEELSDEVLLALRRIADKSISHFPYFDNMHEYQRLAEIAMVQDWAREMRRFGHSVCKVKSNEDDPPDVLAEMDGNLIGIEVTMLVEYVGKHHTCLWTREQFQVRLNEIVRKKDKQAHSKKAKRGRERGEHALDRHLHRRILLIVTAEMYLQVYLARYLATTKLPRPEHFDCVFVMGDYVPDGGSGHHPVFEVSLSPRTMP